MRTFYCLNRYSEFEKQYTKEITLIINILWINNCDISEYSVIYMESEKSSKNSLVIIFI